VDNPAFAAGGGSPYQGQTRPLCDAKLFTVQPGKASSGNFNLFTPTPIPGKLWGLINDDLNLSTNPQDIMFGEKRGLANVPIGIYDYSNRLITTVLSDPNGFYDLTLPSTGTYNCPLPAGPCPNVYRLVGNDPGQPGSLNAYYNPQYKTISASFEVWPGLVIPADHAPIPNGSMIATPGSQNNQPAQCKLDSATPQIFTVSKPYARLSDSATNRTITINGDSFSTAGTVTLTNSAGTTTTLVTSSWSNRAIVLTVPNTQTPGTYQLNVNVGTQKSPNGLTFNVIGSRNGVTYNPKVYEVGPGLTSSNGVTRFNSSRSIYTFPYDRNSNKGPVQAALDAAANDSQALVVVYPGTGVVPTNPNGNSLFNANGAYFENLVIHSALKLQGVGPGGIYSDGSSINGSVIDGSAFGNETYGDGWRTNYAGLANPNTPLGEGAAITVIGNNRFNTNGWNASVDGLLVTGGDQMGTNTKANSVPGGVVITQGGGIFLYQNAQKMQITNNIIRGNGGAYGGGIRIGTPFVAGGTNNNTNLKISYNRIISNGGTNLAGGIGIFNGTNSYEIDHNDVCGNYSGEYGGGISQYGNSPGGKIHDNRIYFNTSFDEGGGIILAGELPGNPANLSQGTGAIDIYNNQIQANLANDDGGGIRLLMAGNFPINIYNNMIVNNVSTHEGGGIAIDDAPNTRIYNNTIMKNITTATASTSNGLPAPAGISTAGNSTQLQATLPTGSPTFSNPLLFNNILWDNRAGHWSSSSLQLVGIGLTGDATPINYWDMGAADGSGLLSPTNSVLQSTTGTVSSTTNVVSTDPQVVKTYDLSVAVFPWRTNPTFTGAAVVAVELPPNLLGDYHLSAATPATIVNGGVPSKTVGNTTVNAPAFDIDNQNRTTPISIGADER
jgi:hypothetical protein